MKSIGLPEELHKEIINLKLETGQKNVGELIRNLIVCYKQKRYFEASNLFQGKLKEKKIAFGNFLKSSKKVREEITDEWFS